MALVEQEVGRVGRPRVLDETKRREICALISAGVSLRRAAEYVGCSYVTVYRERRRDDEFRNALGRAKATRQLAPLQMMRQSAQTHWRAAAWLLERLDPEQFGRRRPHAFGASELRSLASDLMAIFDDAIDRPELREQVSQQVQATVNYAMHHAWDRRRTGKSLRRAMQLFNSLDAAKPAADPWDELEQSLFELAHSSGLSTPIQATGITESFVTSHQADVAKVGPGEFEAQSTEAAKVALQPTSEPPPGSEFWKRKQESFQN
ncbi:MAG: hypothetical protein AAGD11_15430 [Planctomycetota bacterium]